jgi:hypothetical protein
MCNEQAEQRFRLMRWRRMKNVSNESSNATQKYDNASDAQFGAIHKRCRQIHSAGLYTVRLAPRQRTYQFPATAD